MCWGEVDYVFSQSCNGPYPASCIVPELAVSALPEILLEMYNFSHLPCPSPTTYRIRICVKNKTKTQ